MYERLNVLTASPGGWDAGAVVISVPRPVVRREAPLLRQEAQAAARPGVGCAAEQADLAGVGLEETQDAAERRALAGAVDADEAGYVARADGHGHRLDAAPAGESLGEISNSQELDLAGHTSTTLELD